MPTGGGKSLCYQLPSLVLEGCTVVVSPLIALMKDQADSVNKKLKHEHYAHVLNSSIPAGKQTEIKAKVHEGETKLIYVSPEWLSVEANQVFLDSINPPLIAIDEAHCVSEWGHDFRPEYRNIRKYLSGLSKQPTIICLTATATPFVQQDIIDNLKLKDVNVFKASFNRPNLSYFIQPKLPQAALHQAIAKEVLQHPQKRESSTVCIEKLPRRLRKCCRTMGSKPWPIMADCPLRLGWKYKMHLPQGRFMLW